MSMFRSLRLLGLAFLLSLVPASSFAGVFVSVGFAPPALPVYDVPPCPEPGSIWTPGYWAYGDEGYYWVPGAWVPAAYEGALWTPGYWGWGNGLYMWHPGYWGDHVGYYGGINYGGGYFGIGFAGGEWRGHNFFYNTEVLRVGPSFRFSFRDRGYMDHAYVDRDHHVAFSGGPGGIRHEALAEERFAEHDRHVTASSFQADHERGAMSDRGSYFHNNGGRPANLAMEHPMGYQAQPQHGQQQMQMQQQRQQEPQRFQQNQIQQQQQQQRFQQQPTQQQPAQQQRFQQPVQQPTQQQRPPQQQPQQQHQQAPAQQHQAAPTQQHTTSTSKSNEHH